MCKQVVPGIYIYIYIYIYIHSSPDISHSYSVRLVKHSVARGAWFSEVCSGRKTQETAVSKWVKCKMRNTCVVAVIGVETG